MLFIAEDSSGNADSVTVQIGGTTNPAMSIGDKTVVTPVTEPGLVRGSKKYTYKIGLKDSPKYAFCDETDVHCTTGLNLVASLFFKKKRNLQVDFKNLKTGKTCHSTDATASRVTPITPVVGYQPIGYRVGFDPDCGSKASKNFDGVVVSLYIVGSSQRYDYMSAGWSGFSSTEQVTANLATMATFNRWSCFSGQILDVVKKVSEINDKKELAAALIEGGIASGGVTLLTQTLANSQTKPIPGTTSCDATKLFQMASTEIKIENALGFRSRAGVQLRDDVVLKGSKSTLVLSLLGPTGAASTVQSWHKILALSGSEEDVMLVRRLMLGVARR